MKEDTGPSEVEKTLVGECVCLQCASRERAWNLEQVRVCGAGEAKVDEGEGCALGTHQTLCTLMLWTEAWVTSPL